MTKLRLDLTKIPRIRARKINKIFLPFYPTGNNVFMTIKHKKVKPLTLKLIKQTFPHFKIWRTKKDGYTLMLKNKRIAALPENYYLHTTAFRAKKFTDFLDMLWSFYFNGYLKKTVKISKFFKKY